MICLDPQTGEVSEKHADFMTMTACFRCHTLTEPPPEGMKAPGACASCHPASFDLKPANHKEAGFYPKGHAELAMAPLDRSTGRPDTEAEPSEETSGEALPESSEASGEAEAEAAEGEESEYTGSGAEEHIFPISPVEEVDYCSTCHLETFCTDCHGMEMPHSEEFKTKTHPELVATKYDRCQMCHAPETTFFCEKCHHGEQVGWEYDTTADWRTQHGRATVETGVSACTTTCHEVQFCVDCHAAEQPVPTSHDAADWLHKDLTVTKYPDTPAVASAKHALDAQKSIDSCDICHGPGGIAAKFCADCHKIEIPHPRPSRRTT